MANSFDSIVAAIVTDLTTPDAARLTTLFGAGSFGQTYVVERQAFPQLEPRSDDAVQVAVIERERLKQRVDRSETKHRYGVDIGICATVAGASVANCQPLTEFAMEIDDYLGLRDQANAPWISSTLVPFDPQQLRDSSRFIAVVHLTYDEVRA